jgi:methyl-galactoside transport system permease protein
MQEAKSISRTDYAKIFLGIGAFLVILGIVFNFILEPSVFYDLPMYI